MVYTKGSDGRPIIVAPYPECPVCGTTVYYSADLDPTIEQPEPYARYRRFCRGCEQWAHEHCMMKVDGKHRCFACLQSSPNLGYVHGLALELANPGELGFDALVTLFSMLMYFQDDVDKISEFTKTPKDEIQTRIDNLIRQKIWVDGKLLMEDSGDELEEVVDFLMIALASEGMVERTLIPDDSDPEVVGNHG